MDSATKNVKRKAVRGYPGIQRFYDFDPALGAYRPRKTGFVYYAYKRLHGRIYAKSFLSFEEAISWKRSAVAHVVDGRAEVTLRALVPKYLQHKRGVLRDSTVRSYQKLTRYFDFLLDIPCKEISSHLVDEWLTRIKSPEYLSGQHRTRIEYAHEVQFLSTLLKYYGEYFNEAYVHPVRSRHRKDCVVSYEMKRKRLEERKSRYLSVEEARSFLKHLRDDCADLKETELIPVLGLIQLEHGVRVSEAAALSWEDVDFERRSLRIWRTVDWPRIAGSVPSLKDETKTGKARTIPLGCENVLKQLRTHAGRERGLIFSPDGVELLKYRAIQYRYDKALRMAGSRFTGTHLMRHTFATQMLEGSLNQRAVGEMLGHSTEAMTRHYAKATPRLMESAYRVFEPVFSPLLEVFEEEQNRAIGFVSQEVMDTDGSGEALKAKEETIQPVE